MDLSTTYMNMRLRTPLVASASPLSHDLDGIRRLEDAGASAIVLYSLFEEQLRQESMELEYHLAAGTESFAESLTYFPQPCELSTGPEGYLRPHIEGQKGREYTRLSPASMGPAWADGHNMPKQIEQAGADAIECNIYFIPDGHGDVRAAKWKDLY